MSDTPHCYRRPDRETLVSCSDHAGIAAAKFYDEQDILRDGHGDR